MTISTFYEKQGIGAKLKQSFKNQSDLVQRPDFQDVYESLQDWLPKKRRFLIKNARMHMSQIK